MSTLRQPPVPLLLVALTLRTQETHVVPQEHGTIQAAIDAAGAGDTIVVSAWTYEEAVPVPGRSSLLICDLGHAASVFRAN